MNMNKFLLSLALIVSCAVSARPVEPTPPITPPICIFFPQYCWVF